MDQKKETMLEERKRIKKSKPVFVVKESHFSARIEKRWRCPRGRHSGTRQYYRGRPRLVNPGYGSPALVKGLHPCGLEVVVVSNKKELLSLDLKKQGAVIAKIGTKKRLELLQLAKERKIPILNIKDVEKKIDSINSAFLERKKLKEEKLKEKDKKQEEKRKKADEKKKKEEKEKEEKKAESQTQDKNEEIKEKQDEQKKEIEKVIIKKN